MKRIPDIIPALMLLAGSFAAADTAYSLDNWQQWRGPKNDGVASGDAPAEFSATQNVKWRVPIPGKGNSTPVIWGDRIFLTTAVPTEAISGSGDQRGPGGGTGAGVEHKFVVMAIDKSSGKTIWERTATVTKPHEGYHHQYGSFASNSPVTDGATLFAYFGSRGIYAYDLDGNLKWKRDLPVKMQKRLAFGEGTAPVVHENVLLLNCDHEGQSFLLALNKNTGEQLWRTDRDEQSSWTPPLVVEHQGRKQIVVGGAMARSYDFKTGELIWQAGKMGANAIPAPVQFGDMVILMTGYRDPNLLAIKLGGKGDLSDNPEYIKWTNDRGNSYSASPVLHDGILYVLTDRGMISAFDAATGEKYYHQQRLPNPYTFKGSPLAANGKLYMASEEGDVIVLKLGKTYEPLAVNKMGDEIFISSPIIVDNNLFLRSQDELFCISKM